MQGAECTLEEGSHLTLSLFHKTLNISGETRITASEFCASSHQLKFTFKSFQKISVTTLASG